MTITTTHRGGVTSTCQTAASGASRSSTSHSGTHLVSQWRCPVFRVHQTLPAEAERAFRFVALRCAGLRTIPSRCHGCNGTVARTQMRWRRARPQREQQQTPLRFQSQRLTSRRLREVKGRHATETGLAEHWPRCQEWKQVRKPMLASVQRAGIGSCWLLPLLSLLLSQW